MYLINADDFGLSPSINKAIILCFERGIINSTTLIANSPYTDQAIANSNDLIIGCHLNLVEGVPLNKNLLNYPELTNNGNSLKFNIPRSSLSLNRELLLNIKTELSMQIEYIYDNGLSVDHIDSHQHTHTIYPIFKIVHELSNKYNLKIRLPRYTGSSRSIHKKIYKKLLSNYMKFKNINYCDYFINFDEMHLFNNSHNLIEVMIHPDIKDDLIVCNTTGIIIDNV